MVIQPQLLGQANPCVSKDSLRDFKGPVVPLGRNLDNGVTLSWYLNITGISHPWWWQSCHARSHPLAGCSFLPLAFPVRDCKEMPMKLVLDAGLAFASLDLPLPGKVELSVLQKIWGHCHTAGRMRHLGQILPPLLGRALQPSCYHYYTTKIKPFDFALVLPFFVSCLIEPFCVQS